MRYKGVADSRSKKTGESGMIFAAFFSSPEAERQKGGLYVDIKRTEKNRESC